MFHMIKCKCWDYSLSLRALGSVVYLTHLVCFFLVFQPVCLYVTSHHTSCELTENFNIQFLL